MVDSKQEWKAWLYLLPAIILLLVFTVWPIINTVIIAFSDNYKALGGTFDGFGIVNFIKVLQYEIYLSLSSLFSIRAVTALRWLVVAIVLHFTIAQA